MRNYKEVREARLFFGCMQVAQAQEFQELEFLFVAITAEHSGRAKDGG